LHILDTSGQEIHPMRKMMIVALAALPLAACQTANDRAVGGALIGGATGAAIGGLATGRAGGALAGGAIGAIGGAAVGAATAPRRSYGCPYGVYYDAYGNAYCR
jgi:hypothetical protein